MNMMETRDHARSLSTRATSDTAIRALQAIATAADVLANVTHAIDDARGNECLADTADIAAIMHDMASDVAGQDARCT